VRAAPNLESAVQAQLLTYLKLTGLKRGLLINFKVERLVDGIKRVSL
jgi:GxxExxY protein